MDKSLEYLKKNVKKNSIAICATSGGPDSMVLLYLLLKLRKELNLKIICAHINHKLRKESDEEYLFVKKYAQNNDIIFEGTTFNCYNKNNIESEAHRMRYNFFEKIVKKYSADILLTAHHGDDLVETILMRLTRGSSLESAIGFDIKLNLENYLLLRPLVFYTKTDILEYANKNNIEYRIDKTNFDDKYTRNRYRKYILPFLKEEEKNVHLKYLRFNNELKTNNEYINGIVLKQYNKCFKENYLFVDKLLQQDEFIRKKVIYRYLKNYYGNYVYLIRKEHIEFVNSIVENKKPNININLPNNFILEKNYNILNLNSRRIFNDYKMEIKDKDIILPFGILKKVNNTKLKNNYVCYLNSKDLTLPLFVRNKKEGDKIELLGLNRVKKVKDIFINEKVNYNKRKSYPVVVDAKDTVVWLPGLKKSKYDAIKTGKYDIILWYDEEEYYEQ